MEHIYEALNTALTQLPEDFTIALLVSNGRIDVLLYDSLGAEWKTVADVGTTEERIDAALQQAQYLARRYSDAEHT